MYLFPAHTHLCHINCVSSREDVIRKCLICFRPQLLNTYDLIGRLICSHRNPCHYFLQLSCLERSPSVELKFVNNYELFKINVSLFVPTEPHFDIFCVMW
jgi:hypothetical protein